MQPVVQWIQVMWTKASRGGPGAAVRNAAPSGFLLPVAGAPLTHDVVMTERDGFDPQFAYEAASIGTFRGPLRHGEVDIQQKNDDLYARLAPSIMGNPPRRRRPPAFQLGPGEWGRWVINYRFSGYRGWSYSQVTMNLANGPVPLDTFLGRPTRTMDDRAHLF